MDLFRFPPRLFRILRIQLTLALLLALQGMVVPGARAGLVHAPHTKIELISDVSQIGPVAPFWLGVRYVVEEGWHIYWRNPGDSGAAPEFEWSLPEGWKKEPVQWPLPERVPVSHLMNYGYKGEVILPVRVIPTGRNPSPEPFRIEVGAAWLVCKEECVPAEASLSLQIPVGAEKRPSAWAEEIRNALEQVPRDAGRWSVRVLSRPESYEIRLTPLSGNHEAISRADFFPADPLTIHNAAPQRLEKSDSHLSLFVRKDPARNKGRDTLQGALGLFSGDSPAGPEEILLVHAQVGKAFPFWRAVLLALLGGILLNLMPCVFPVISIKILSFAEHARREEGRPVAHGLLYALGILLSFWVLSGLLFALRAAGTRLGWGFQLQSPVFLTVMAVLFFLIGLNLLGVFEVGFLFTRLGGVGAGRSGYGGSFLSGILATLIATPCTAPFMGSAVGFALSQPVAAGLSIFTALGAGMALPYMILSSQPALVRRLPRPGPWMENLKQFLAFPMFATLIWILWVLGNQAGLEGVIRCLSGLFLVSLGIWLLKRASPAGGRPGIRASVRAVAAAVILLGLLGAFRGVSERERPAHLESEASRAAAWEPFSEERIQELRRAGRPLFVNFTAAWCITCQVNKRLVLDHPEVLRAFKRHGVTLMKADWTNRDETIGRSLARYGRQGVPVYALYGRESGSEPVLLPEVLTVGLVIETLEQRVPTKEPTMETKKDGRSLPCAEEQAC